MKTKRIIDLVPCFKRCYKSQLVRRLGVGVVPALLWLPVTLGGDAQGLVASAALLIIAIRMPKSASSKRNRIVRTLQSLTLFLSVAIIGQSDHLAAQPQELPPTIPAVVSDSPPSSTPADSDVRWRIATADCRFHTNFHRRQRVGDAKDEIETLQITAGNGTYVRIVTAIEPVRVIDETEIVVPIKSDRRDLQILARIVLPRSQDPVTGGPMTLLLRGALYRDRRNWQRLVLSDIPRKRDEAVRVQRLRSNAKIDVRESYVDLLCLNVYGGVGKTTVQIATPNVDGQPQPIRYPTPQELATTTSDSPTNTSVVANGARVRRLPPDNERSATLASGVRPVDYEGPLLTETAGVKTDGNLFFINGRPTFIRMIDHRGEEMAFLRQLGFNTVRLDRLATAAEIDEAAQNGLWIVCPPPASDEVALVPSAYRRIIAWDLGERLATSDLESTVARVHQIRSNASLASLPVLASPDTDLHAFSNHLDVIVHHRETIGTDLSFPRYVRWLRSRRTLASPTAMHWATIQTEPLAALEQQWQQFHVPMTDKIPIEFAQLQHVVFGAVGAGMRGLHFRSRTPLNGTGASSQGRAAMLRLVNLELDRIEPWATAGQQVGSADTKVPGATTFVSHTQRGDLLCLLQSTGTDQFVSAKDRSDIAVTVPGASATSEVYQLTDSGVKSLTTTRVAGGSRIELNDSDSPTFVVMSHHPVVIKRVTQVARETLPHIARLRYHLAHQSLRRAQETAAELRARDLGVPIASHELSRAQAQLAQAANEIHEKRYGLGAKLARSAAGSIAAAQSSMWQRSIQALPSPVASPLCTQIGTVAWHWHLVRDLPASQGVFNLLQTGDFEQADLTGWQSYQHAPPDVAVDVRLSPDGAHSGKRCLRMRAYATTAAANQSAMESPLVWLNSPPIDVRGDQIVKIEGMVKIPNRIAGSADGVLIFDSLGGAELGYRLLKTEDWQPFVLYRASRKRCPVTITVALTGLGEVFIDRVVLTPVVALSNAKLDEATATATATATAN